MLNADRERIIRLVNRSLKRSGLSFDKSWPASRRVTVTFLAPCVTYKRYAPIPAASAGTYSSVASDKQKAVNKMPKHDNKFFARIYEVVRQVPRGRVASYGQIAGIVGAGCDARMVGYAMHGAPEGSDVPWQRIVNREGRISLPGEGGVIQRMRLEAEGIVFDARGRIDMKRFGWQGPDPAWAAEHGYHVEPREEEPPEPEQPSLL